MLLAQLAQAVECWPHLAGGVHERPSSDVETIETELVLKDLETVEKRLDKARRASKSNDVGEKKDLASEKPKVVKELAAAYERWDGQLSKPLWGRPRR